MVIFTNRFVCLRTFFYYCINKLDFQPRREFACIDYAFGSVFRERQKKFETLSQHLILYRFTATFSEHSRTGNTGQFKAPDILGI